MMGLKSILIVFATLALVLGSIQPTTTKASQNTFRLDGWTPKPTNLPFDLLRRQAGGNPNTICGYVNGDPSAALDCSGNLCGYNTHYGWFGCCSSSITSAGEIEPAGCPVVTTCIPYNLLSECDSDCDGDTMIRKCTNSATPFCAVGTLVDPTGLSDWVCATDAFTIGVALTPTASGALPSETITSASVPVIGAGAPPSSPEPTTAAATTSSSSTTPSTFVLPGTSTESTVSTATVAAPTHVSSGAANTLSPGVMAPLGCILALLY